MTRHGPARPSNSPRPVPACSSQARRVWAGRPEALAPAASHVPDGTTHTDVPAPRARRLNQPNVLPLTP